MSDDRLESLSTRIKEGALLAFSLVEPSDLEGLLDGRDSPEFEQKWLDVFESVDCRAGELDEAQTAAVDALREVSYKAAFSVSENPDFAAFVCDDFELIGLALILGINDPWLNGLWLSYRDNRFPSGQVDDRPGTLSELLE